MARTSNSFNEEKYRQFLLKAGKKSISEDSDLVRVFPFQRDLADYDPQHDEANIFSD